VLFISYPEVWTGALESWEPVADNLMAATQRDPTIAFIVTYGHRPAYSSLTDNGWDPTVRAALNKLARRYSPHPSNPRGKYVVNLAHHVHGFEVFAPIRGLTHITDAGGGQGVADVRTAAKRSLLRLAHLGVLAGDYDAASSRLTLRWVCGPAFGDKATCGYGDTVWSTTFTAYGAPHLPPRPPALVGPAVANGPVRAADPPAGPGASVDAVEKGCGPVHNGVAGGRPPVPDQPVERGVHLLRYPRPDPAVLTQLSTRL
jgi:hypothetical protein